MNNLLQTLWPLFALIIAGYLLQKRRFPGEGFWPGAERINYFILFPALLFGNLIHAPLDSPALLPLGGAALTTLLLGYGLLLLGRRRYRWPARRFGVLVQGSLRFNTYLGLAIISALYGSDGLARAAIVLALLVPTVNMLSVWSLTAEQGVSAATLLRPMLRNPLILACLAGILCNLSGLAPDAGSQQLLKLLAAASLPLGLLCVGAALNPRELSGEVPALAGNTLFRLTLMPVLAAALAGLFGLPALEALVVILFFALPTAPTAYVLTRQLQGDSHLMAGLITLQTLVSAASLSVVLGVFLIVTG